MTIQELFQLKDKLIARMDESSSSLATACAPHKGVMGLLSDEYKASDEYANLTKAYQFDRSQMEIFWKMVRGNKEFKKADRERTLAKRYANIK